MINYWEKEGASMIWWTTLDPCTHLSENDPKQLTNFGICENKDHKHFINTLVYKAKQSILTNTIQKESLHIFRRQCKW